MGDSLENTESAGDTQNIAIVDFQQFANYVTKAVTILLPESDSVDAPYSLQLNERSNQECIKKFLSDPQVPALYIQRSNNKGNSLINSYQYQNHTSIFCVSFNLIKKIIKCNMFYHIIQMMKLTNLRKVKKKKKQ